MSKETEIITSIEYWRTIEKVFHVDVHVLSTFSQGKKCFHDFFFSMKAAKVQSSTEENELLLYLLLYLPKWSRTLKSSFQEEFCLCASRRELNSSTFPSFEARSRVCSKGEIDGELVDLLRFGLVFGETSFRDCDFFRAKEGEFALGISASVFLNLENNVKMHQIIIHCYLHAF